MPSNPDTKTTARLADIQRDLLHLVRSVAETLSIPQDEPESLLEYIEATLYLALDVVALVRQSPDRAFSADAVVSELKQQNTPEAMTFLAVLSMYGGVKVLRKRSERAVMKLSGCGVRCHSESLLRALLEPKPVSAWIAAGGSDGESIQIWCVSGGPKTEQPGGVRVLSLVVDTDRAVAVVLDSYADEDEFMADLYATASESVLTVREISWQTAHELISQAWKDILEAGGDGFNEAAYLRPWIEEAILTRTSGPASRGRSIDPAPDIEMDEVQEAVLGMVTEYLEAESVQEELCQTAESLWCDFLDAADTPVEETALNHWAAALAYASELVRRGESDSAQIAREFDVTEEELLERHEQLWEPIAVDGMDSDEEELLPAQIPVLGKPDTDDDAASS